MRVDLDPPAVALAVVAHPDDAEFECGGTLAKWAESGTEVHHLVCTDGSKGTWDPDADTVALVARRRDEQAEAARRLGATGSVHHLGAVDGELRNDIGTRSRVAHLIRRLRPDVVLAHDPWRRWRLHPDHRAAGFLAVAAVVAARDPHFHRDHGLAPHRPAALLVFECEEPDHVEALAERHVDAKIAALLAHESQFETTMGITDPTDPDQRAAFARRIHEESRREGRRAGVARGEAFRLLDPAS